MTFEAEESPKGLRVAQYVRMSTDKQKYSTENQKDAIAAYAVRRGLTIVRTYSMKAAAGSISNAGKACGALLMT
jgi:Resolvase, N terminal domain